MKYFGDSYDIVKVSLIGWLHRFGDWSVHPMLTEMASISDIHAFQRFLGARVVSTEVLTTTTNREEYFSCVMACGNLFLDPDTGLQFKSTRPSRSSEYLYSTELELITSSRPKALTLVFDQSLPRGNERKTMEDKLKRLVKSGVHCFAYISHACFIVAGHDKSLVDSALTHVLSESRLPLSRFLTTSTDAL